MSAEGRIQAPKGTEDWLSPDWRRRARIEAAAGEVFERAGYGPIETPIFEDTDLFERGVGESTDIVRKEMFTFEDLGGRRVTLRPEGTASVCRAYVQHGMHKLAQPVRLWYRGPFFRYEAPQAGRYRQFNQIGAEAIGSDLPETDAESIAMLDEILRGLGVPSIELTVGSIGSRDARAEYRNELASYLHANEGDLSEAVRERIDTNPLRAFDAKDPGTRAVMEGAPKLLDRLEGEDASHFAAVCERLDALDIDYTVDPTLVRGLDYYTRTVFAFSCAELGAQSEVGGGGRYDGLVAELGGPDVPGVGWAAGIERIALALDAGDSERDGKAVEAVGRDAFIAVVSPAQRIRALVLVDELRRKGLSAEMDLAGRSMKGQLKQADRVGARHTVILEEDGTAQLKEMQSGEQRQVDSADLLTDLLGS